MSDTTGMHIESSVTSMRRWAAFASVIVAVAFLMAACSSGAPAASGPPLTPTNGVIELELTGSLQIVQGGQRVTSIEVHQGQAYTFRIRNSAGFAHDFLIGTDADLSSGKSGLPGLGQFSSGTQDFSVTFDGPGPLMFGCTIPGHYSLMKGTFVIVP